MNVSQRQRLSRSITTIVGGLVVATAPSASDGFEANTPDPAIEEIVVTGSRIPRRDNFAASPIVTLDRTELELAGTTEIKNLLNNLPQVDPTADAGTGNVFGGESFINLRALGSNRTLVLLNGRRYPSQGNNGSVDLNAIPPTLIEKIEVITGGASAVYGSDAMAGAVNFILRDNFVGLESNLQYDVTDRGDGDKVNIDITYGTPIADGAGSVVLSANYFERSEIFQDARSFSRVQIISDDEVGELLEFGSFASASSSIAGIGPFYAFEPDGRPRLFVEPDDRFNLAPFSPLIAPMKRYSFSAFSHYEFGSNLGAHAELSYTRSLPTQKVADEFFSFVDLNVDRPDLAPEFRNLLATAADDDGDGIATVFLGRTFSPERGPSTVKYTSDFYRVLVGFDGDWPAGWAWAADVSYSSNERETRAINDISVGRIRQGLLVDPATGACFDSSRNCVPVNPFGAGNLSTAAGQFITLSGTAFTERSTEIYLTAGAHGSPLRLPGGNLDVAVGAEFRRFEFRNAFPNGNLQSGDSLLFPRGINPLRGTISVREAYVEARVPIVQDRPGFEYLGLDIGGRLSDYNILDEVVATWKAGVEWQWMSSLRFRAMHQHAIRAPGMSDLFQGVSFAFTDFEFGPAFDACSASKDPIGNGLTDVCVAQGLPPDQVGIFEAGFFPVAVSASSNPNARPERADTFSIGFVWQPESLPGLSTSIDYFNIEIDDALANADHRDLARICFLSRDAGSDACRSFTRAPSGDIDSGLITVINSAIATSEGVDLSLNTEWPGDDASFKLSVLATHYFEAGSQGSGVLPFLDCAGKFAAFCNLRAYQGSVPDWRGSVRLSYARGDFLTSLQWSHIGSLTNAEPESRRINGAPPPILAVPKLPSVNYVDLTVSYDVGEQVTLTFGLENLFDKQPPILGSAEKDANTDPTTYDILGRRYFLRATFGY